MNPVLALRKLAFEYLIGDKGLSDLSWQAPFPEEIDCDSCPGKARPMFSLQDDELHELHYSNNPEHSGGIWPHDSVAVTVYLCKECGKAQALWNQA